MEKTKILIIGGGPAGATTSLFLAKKGIPHILVDAATFPRDKICGDGLDLKVARVLNALDPSITTEVFSQHGAFYPVHAMRLIPPSGRPSLFHYQPGPNDPPHPLFWTSKRLEFDHFLVQRLDQAYVDFRQGFEVTSLVRTGNTWQVYAKHGGAEVQIEADFVIGADGDHSVVLRSLGQREINKTHYAASVRQYWKNVGGMAPEQAIDVYMPPKLPMSYFYMFPLPNNEVNVGYGMVSQIVSKHKYNLRELFGKLIVEDPYLRDRFKNAEPLEKPRGWGLPLASVKRKTFGNGYLLIGDAASMICPTSGEGIGTGMMSGLIAAEFLERAVQTNDFSEHTFRHFDREIYRRLHGEINTYSMVMKYQPWALWDAALNFGSDHFLVKRHFKRQVGSWLRTAYEKPVEINLD